LGAGLTLGSSGLYLAFWCPGREITMTAPNRNYELKTYNKLMNFSLIFLIILKILERRKSKVFISSIHFAAHFAAPWILLPTPSLDTSLFASA
jgi:hypothetical protein